MHWVSANYLFELRDLAFVKQWTARVLKHAPGVLINSAAMFTCARLLCEDDCALRYLLARALFESSVSADALSRMRELVSTTHGDACDERTVELRRALRDAVENECEF
jgi:hypothetical protein